MSEKIRIDGEPKIVSEIRDHILEEFKDLTFVEEGHKYFLDGRSIPSVSAVVHRFANEFDSDAIATNYAIKNGGTKEFWQDQWKFKNLRATTTGTLVHEYGESLGWMLNGHPEFITPSCKPKYVADKKWLIPTRPKEEAILDFYTNLDPNLHFVLAETKVYSNKGEASMVKEQFCGTFDLLFYYKHPTDDSKSGLIIEDYKTNASLMNSYARQTNKMMLPPFGDMYDEALSHYVLQQSLYSMCLRGIGLDVKGIRLIWLKEKSDNNGVVGEYELVKINDLSKEKWFKEAF